MTSTNLSLYNNAWYNPGASAAKRFLWHYINGLFFNSPLFPINSLKISLLRLFGAKVGKGVVIKPSVNIKYPWFLQIGDHTWIGEQVWIDNLNWVNIGSHCCLSQGAMLLTGNHNYKTPTFDLMVSPITLEDGVWIGAKSIVCPNITCYNHAVLQAGGVATKNLLANKIYAGNPAQIIKDRFDA